MSLGLHSPRVLTPPVRVRGAGLPWAVGYRPLALWAQGLGSLDVLFFEGNGYLSWEKPLLKTK